MANSRGLYSFVFLGFIKDSPLAFSCVGELYANRWGLANFYWKGRQTLPNTHKLEKKMRPAFLSSFFLYFIVTCKSYKQKESQKHCDLQMKYTL